MSMNALFYCLYEVLCLLSVCGSGEAVNEVNIVQVSKWLHCVYKSMDEFGHNDATLTELRSLKMLPLTNGSVTSTAVDTVFFPIRSTAERRGACSWMLMMTFSFLCAGVITVIIVVMVTVVLMMTDTHTAAI